MTDERNAETVAVAHLRELLAKAIPQAGRWYASPWHIEEGASAVRADGYGIVCNCASDTQANLIAAMREALPALLDELDALRALQARVEAAPSSFPISTGTLNYRCAMTEVPFDMIGKRVRLLIEEEGNAVR